MHGGLLYGEIRTRGRPVRNIIQGYTTLNGNLRSVLNFVCGRADSEDSAQRRFRSFIFGLTCIGGGFYPGSLKNCMIGQNRCAPAASRGCQFRATCVACARPCVARSVAAALRPVRPAVAGDTARMVATSRGAGRC